MFEGVRKLLPGHYLLAEGGGSGSASTWWDVGAEPLGAEQAVRRAEYAAAVLELLDDAVRLRMLADVPVGGVPERRGRLQHASWR